jgi:hypothetical protein
MRQTLACQEHETASSHSETKLDAEEVKPCVAAMRNKVFSHSGCGDYGPWSRVWLVRSDRELIAGHTCYSTAYHEVMRDSSLLACSYYGKKGRIIGSRRCKSCDRLSSSSRALDSNRNHVPIPSKIPPAVMFLIFTARFCDVTICLLNQRIAFTFGFVILCLPSDAFALLC